MNDFDLQEDLNKQFRLRFIWATTTFFDAFFLIFWIFFQWIVGQMKILFALTGLDESLYIVFQILFAVSTVAPIAIFIYKDLRIMIIRTQLAIKSETKKKLQLEVNDGN